MDIGYAELIEVHKAIIMIIIELPSANEYGMLWQ